MSTALVLFSFVSFNLTSVFILQPPQAKEAFLVTQFQDDIESFYVEPTWPQNYQRMNLIKDQNNYYNTFVHSLSKLSKNKTFIRYQFRIFFSNRTYIDSEWIYSIWNRNFYNNYYNSFTVTLGLLCVLSFIISIYIIYFKIKHF